MTSSVFDATCDVIVVGAGPAGLSAAVHASQAGATVALLDASSAPGGQYWRQPASPGQPSTGAPWSAPGLNPDDLNYLHHDLRTYRDLIVRLGAGVESGSIDYLPQHHVWALERDNDKFVVHAVDRAIGERGRTFQAARLVLAPGAYDRQVPFPGWTLPGVITAGGAQALLKGHGVRAGERIVVAGTGPFLLPVAAGLATSGAHVVGVHEAGSVVGWLPHVGAVLRNVSKLGEGASYARALARHRVPVRMRSILIAANGTDQLESVVVARTDARGQVIRGTEERIACDTLTVGWGFTPQLELPLALGADTRIDSDGSLVCIVDDEQQSNVEGLFIAGEACGVGGASLAHLEGSIAGAAAAGQRLVDRRTRRQRAALRAFARAIHSAHPVPTAWMEYLTDSTVVCRCEEVTAGRLRHAVDELGAVDARGAKLLVRVGMGWCQGRVCGYASSCLTAAWGETQANPASVASRPIATPVRLGTLAVDPTSLVERHPDQEDD